jgi:hypothetical protein
MKNESRNVFLFLLVLLFVYIATGCGSKQPDIAGLWEADFWDGVFIKFAPNLQYYVYDDVDALDNKEQLGKGIYRFYEYNNQSCFGMANETAFLKGASKFMGSAIEFIDNDQITLIADERCFLEEGWEHISGDANIETVNLKRVE